MLAALLIVELSGAFVASKLGTVERLHDEAVDLFAEVELAAAVGTRALSLTPLFDARIAAELVAILTLLGILDHHEADSACEISIELIYRLLRL